MDKTSKIILHSVAIIILIISFIMFFGFYTKGYGLAGGIFVDITASCFVVIMYYCIAFILIHVYSRIFHKTDPKKDIQYQPISEPQQWHRITISSKIEPEFREKANFMINWFILLPCGLFFLWVSVGRYLNIPNVWETNIFSVLTFAIVLGPLFFTGYYLFEKICYKKTIPLLFWISEPETVATPVFQAIAIIFYSCIFIACIFVLCEMIKAVW